MLTVEVNRSTGGAYRNNRIEIPVGQRETSNGHPERLNERTGFFQTFNFRPFLGISMVEGIGHTTRTDVDTNQGLELTRGFHQNVLALLAKWGITNITNLGEIKVNPENYSGQKINAGIFFPGLDGNILIAMEGQKRFDRFNVLLIPPFTGCLHFEKGQALADYAVVSFWDGDNFKIGYAKLASPVPIHAILETVSVEHSEEMFRRRQIPVLNTRTLRATTDDKIKTKEILRRYGILTPPHLIIQKNENLTREEISRKIRAFLKVKLESGFVVKPHDASQGTGVRLFTSREVERGTDFIIESLRKRDLVMVEPRIESAPFYLSGKRMDWNIRVIAVAGKEEDSLRSSEVRYGEFNGKPVNKCKGAKISELRQVWENLGFSEDQIPVINERILGVVKNVSHAINREFNGQELGVLGMDLIIDKSGNIFCIEVNSGFVGGLGSLAEIRNAAGDKSRAAISIAEKLFEVGLGYKEATPLPNDFEDEYLHSPNLKVLASLSSDAGNYRTELVYLLRHQELSGKDQIDSLINIAVAYIHLEKFASAKELLFRVLEIDPENIHALNNLGVIYSRENDYLAALPYLERAFAIDPENINIIAALGFAHGNLKNFERAISYFRKLLVIRPNEYGALLSIALYSNEAGDSEEAIRRFESIFEQYPQNEQVIRSLASLYSRTNNYEKTIKYLELALEFNRQDESVLINLGISFLKQDKLRNLDKALSAFKAAYEINPNNEVALINLGTCYMIWGDHENAIRLFELFLVIEPKRIDVLHQLERMYDKTGQHSKRVSACQRILEIEPENLPALFNIASYYYENAQFEEAMNHYNRALAVNPNDLEILKILADIYKKTNNKPKRIECLERLLAINPEDVNAVYGLGLLYSSEGQFTKGCELFERLLKIDPANQLIRALYLMMKKGAKTKPGK